MIRIYNRPVCILCVCLLISLCLYFTGGFADKKPETFKNGDHLHVSGTIASMCEKENFYGTYLELTLKKVYYYEDNKEKLLLTKTGENILCRIKPDNRIKIGRRLNLSGKVLNFEKARNPGEFNQYLFYTRRGTLFQIVDAQALSYTKSYDRVRQFLYEFKKQNESLLTNYLEPENAAIIKAMLFGNKSEIDSDVKELFQKNGIAHILAISGLHLSLIGMSLYRFLRKTPIPLPCSAVLSELFMILYCVMVGFSPSSFRALLMFSLYLLSGLVKRTYDLMTALSIACILLLLIQPGYLYDCAFLLSFSAILGIGFGYQRFFDNYWKPPRFMQSFFVSFFVFLATLPILSCFYYETAFYSILLNLLIIPLMSLLMGSAIFMLILAYIFPIFTCVPAFFVNVILQIYKVSCSFLEKYGMGRCNIGQPMFWQIALYYLLLTGILLFKNKDGKKKIIVFLTGVLTAVFILLLRVQNGVDIYMLDVGQGDGCVVINENKNVYVMDGGSSSKKEIGKRRIIPFLKYKGVNEIEAVFISHPDEDHMNGIEELLTFSVREHIRVKQIYVTKGLMGKEEFKPLLLQANKAGVKITGIVAGDKIVDQKLSFTCLYPFKNASMEEANNASLVLDLSYKEFHMLCTGDVEESGEAWFTEKIDLNGQSFDVLKVSHHGSNTSTSQKLLDWGKFKVALVSAGSNNPYGHPHKEILERLHKKDIYCLKTMDCGTIMIWTDGKGMKIRTHLYCDKIINTHRLR